MLDSSDQIFYVSLFEDEQLSRISLSKIFQGHPLEQNYEIFDERLSEPLIIHYAF